MLNESRLEVELRGPNDVYKVFIRETSYIEGGNVLKKYDDSLASSFLCIV